MQDQDKRQLIESDLRADPLEQLGEWIEAARQAGQIEPTAMNLATLGPDGFPRARMVLFKGFHQDGFCFYTDYEGAKGRELATAQNVAVTFWWDRLERQVRVEGMADRLSREKSREYFERRPRQSQLGATTSRQSQIVGSRRELEDRYAEIEKKLANQAVPLPERWGGYVIRPRMFEFWQGRRSRLHDRLRYRLSGQDWLIDRLEP